MFTIWCKRIPTATPNDGLSKKKKEYFCEMCWLGILLVILHFNGTNYACKFLVWTMDKELKDKLETVHKAIEIKHEKWSIVSWGNRRQMHIYLALVSQEYELTH